MNMVIDELEVNYDGFYKGYAIGFVTIDNQQSYPFLYRIYSPKNGESWKLVSIENITDLSEDEFKSIESNIKDSISKDVYYDLVIEKNITGYSNKMIYELLDRNKISFSNICTVSLDKKRIVVEMENGDSIYLIDDFNMI